MATIHLLADFYYLFWWRKLRNKPYISKKVNNKYKEKKLKMKTKSFSSVFTPLISTFFLAFRLYINTKAIEKSIFTAIDPIIAKTPVSGLRLIPKKAKTNATKVNPAKKPKTNQNLSAKSLTSGNRLGNDKAIPASNAVYKM